MAQVDQGRIVGLIERLRADRPMTRRALAGRLGRTHQWLDEIVAGRSRISVDDAAGLADVLDARLEVIAPKAPSVVIRAALEADEDLTPEWREAVWAVYKLGKARRLTTPAAPTRATRTRA